MTATGRPTKLYFDANVFIYAVEGTDDIAGQLRSLFKLLLRKPNLAVTSELTLAEVLPKADLSRRKDYIDLISESGAFDLWPVTRAVLLDTVEYRRITRAKAAQSMPKLPDAIHVVTAGQAGCSKMVSFDRGLKLPMELQRVTHDSLSSLIEELS